MCHDVGNSVPTSFVNLLRNLVSSGETQNVPGKNKNTAPMIFEGVIVLASNKNPFTHQQREGILDRRMVYVLFINRVHNKEIKTFKELFPQAELQALASFAVKALKKLFLREVNSHPLVRQQMIKFLYLQNFVERHLTYQKPSWTPYG